MKPQASSFGRRKPISQLAKIAASVGISEGDLVQTIFDRLDEGSVIDCLKIGVQAQFDDWIMKHDLLDGGNFGLIFKLSPRITLRCCCYVDMSGDVPLYRVTQRVFGNPKITPKWFKGMPCFSVQISCLDPMEVFGYV